MRTPWKGIKMMTMESFQQRVASWMAACFGPEISNDKIERNHRFLEEAIELVQANGCTRSEAHQLVDYVYGRPTGHLDQELGGVMVTLAALCLAISLDMHESGERELQRVWVNIDKIRAKQLAKPKHSPLPEAPALTPPRTVEVGDYYRHRKTGHLYEIVANGRIEADLSRAVIYRNVLTGETWVRPADEFFDGRFEDIFHARDTAMGFATEVADKGTK